ncbi:GDSL-type esterase/lipase family protein [Soonwooa sp.]|uniref:GDSL-type esterase/lipase family protein n=1 Tax=Soonwooa sp. TaxID=1938592 RepID=UPI002618DB12|nr:GDSL-type esterase/lipase family protein [Soonwooa sp.]
MKFFFAIPLLVSALFSAQELENTSNLGSFSTKLKSDNQVTNILFLGDSHIQAGWIPKVLREHFQQKYGNAGRGTLFPYAVANSNGPQDYTSVSNQAWETFRLVYEQDVFKEMGALGFVMGNKKDSFLNIQFNATDSDFDEVKIYNDASMSGENFTIYESPNALKDFVKPKKTIEKYTVQEGETFPELAAKFNIVTTRLVQLSGNAIKNPKAGQVVTVERAEPIYDANFENDIKKISDGKFTGTETTFKYPKSTNNFLMETNAKNGNILYGFQFLKSKVTKGVVFNTVGVNGATYADFVKFPLQLQQLKKTNPDVVFISLGTNEGVSSISKDDFIKNAGNLISELRKENINLPIVLISPTDNNMNGKKTAEVVLWIKEVSEKFNTAYLNMYKATGGAGYFSKSLKAKKANADTVHFMQSGYEEQGELIWKAFENYLK